MPSCHTSYIAFEKSCHVRQQGTTAMIYQRYLLAWKSRRGKVLHTSFNGHNVFHRLMVLNIGLENFNNFLNKLWKSYRCSKNIITACPFQAQRPTLSQQNQHQLQSSPTAVDPNLSLPSDRIYSRRQTSHKVSSL